MINDLRTHLLNLDGAGPPSGPGEEYADPAYRAAPLGDGLLAIRAALFGVTPDRRTLLYRARQLLSLVESTPLRDYALADDPRITYDLAGDGGLAPRVRVVAAAGGPPLYLVGDPPVGSVGGRTAYSWDLVVDV